MICTRLMDALAGVSKVVLMRCFRLLLVLLLVLVLFRGSRDEYEEEDE